MLASRPVAHHTKGQAMSAKETSQHAKALSSVGASKGGIARAAALTPEARRAIAREAAVSRWGKDNTVPHATHMGELQIADRRIVCANLNNGQRVLTQETFLTAIGRAAKAKAGTGSERLSLAESVVDGLPPFLAAANLQPFITDKLRALTTPLVFRPLRGGKAYGYDAELLPMVCDVYLDARKHDKLLRSQRHIADASELLIRAFARVGLAALIDEATGCQEERSRDDLRKILEAYVSEELRPWVRVFPEEFFKQIYRIHKWEYKHTTARTPQVGKLINRYIYEQLPPGVLQELQRKNPVTEKEYRKYKHHQYLTVDTGNEHLDRQIAAVTTLMKVADDKLEFERLFLKAFPGTTQTRLPFIIDADPPTSMLVQAELPLFTAQ
jgi:hypothetical protein